MELYYELRESYFETISNLEYLRVKLEETQEKRGTHNSSDIDLGEVCSAVSHSISRTYVDLRGIRDRISSLVRRLKPDNSKEILTCLEAEKPLPQLKSDISF